MERSPVWAGRHSGAVGAQREQALDTWYRVLLAIYPAMKSAQDAVIRLEEDLAGSGICEATPALLQPSANRRSHRPLAFVPTVPSLDVEDQATQFLLRLGVF